MLASIIGVEGEATANQLAFSGHMMSEWQPHGEHLVEDGLKQG
jgi:hypothetical protein